MLDDRPVGFLRGQAASLYNLVVSRRKVYMDHAGSLSMLLWGGESILDANAY